MMTSIWATVRGGRIEPVEPVDLPEGSQVLLTLLGPGEEQFWRGVSQDALASIWDNSEDDVYAQLLKG
jgi:hypothetical protein